MSPVGIPAAPEGYNFESWLFDESTFFTRNLCNFIIFLWKRNWSFFTLLRGIGYIGTTWVLRKFAENCMPYMTDKDEAEANAELMLQNACGEMSSELCGTLLLEPGAYAYLPLKRNAEEIPKPICMIFGENDWSHSDEA